MTTAPAPASPPPPPPLALTRVSTVCFVLRHVRIDSIRDIVKLAHISDTFRDALESYSATVWRRLASRLEGSSLIAFFKNDTLAWAADNLLTAGQLDVSGMELHPLYVAASTGAVGVVRVCIAAMPACVNARGRGGWTALHVASSMGNTECVRELLAAGADITIATTFGYTVLHCATSKGDVGIVRLLTAHPDIGKIRDERTTPGVTALQIASHAGHTECVQLLLAAGVDITVTDINNADTTLHIAVREGNADAVRLLVAHRDFEKIRDVRNNAGKTAMDLAKTNEIKQILSNK